jgi:hypothetical protein
MYKNRKTFFLKKGIFCDIARKIIFKINIKKPPPTYWRRLDHPKTDMKK